MQKQNLTQAHEELFRRSPDECFESLEALITHCHQQKEQSTDRWHLPQEIAANSDDSRLMLQIGSDGAFAMNDWSFRRLCRLARVSKETVNRVSSHTAGLVFRDTLPSGRKPLQLLTQGDAVRSIHALTYTRLWNADLMPVVQEFATDFRPPQKGSGGGTGLYAGEQDLFCFLIDPTGWAEIEGEAFAPGFFLFNSEVGRRSVGISTFWFEQVCANHIVWDAVEIEHVSRKHTTNVHEALATIRRTLEKLVEKRDQRRDGFVQVIRNAMATKLGSDAEEAQKALAAHGVGRVLANKAIEIARRQGAFTIWSVVDALTRLAAEHHNAGDRVEADQQAASILDMAAV
jgi:hypothetical protein